LNLQKLFETQKVMRDRINYQGKDRFEKLILALLVEIGECANEFRGFKFWSKDQEPRTKVAIECPSCDGTGIIYSESCMTCTGGIVGYGNLLLEEYVDGLHFVLEIGLEEFTEYDVTLPVNITLNDLTPIKYETVTKHFNYLYNTVGYFMDCVTDCEFGYKSEVGEQYQFVVRMYLGLGEMLGFTWEEIETAYYAKNQINHDRQENGY
jgi:dimeric dUTPase (all-alpha-NTP-PPase superfamily)